MENKEKLQYIVKVLSFLKLKLKSDKKYQYWIEKIMKAKSIDVKYAIAESVKVVFDD